MPLERENIPGQERGSMKYKSKKIASLLLAFSLVFAAFAPVTSAKAQSVKATEYVGDREEGDAIPADTVFELDESYPEADEEGNVYSSVIPAEMLMQFDGAVALTLEFETTGTSEWPGFQTMTAARTKLAVKGNTSPWAATESLTIMLEEDQVELAVAEGGIQFRLEGMYFTGATLRAATPDDAYVGDWNEGYRIPASELEDYTGEVALVVDYRMLEENPYTWCNFSVNEVDGWRKLSAEEYAFTEYRVDEENLINVPSTDSTAVVVLTEETVATLVEKEGVVIQVYGIIIEDVTVMSATPKDTFTLCTSYPEPDVDGNVVSAAIPAEALLSHGGNVAFTVDYVTTGTVDYPYAVPRTLRWTELTPKGNISYEGESGTITFVLDASDITTAIAENGILFQLNGVYITKAKLAPATAKDYYVGDWNEGYRIQASELAEFTDDVALYIDYRTVDNELYEYPMFSVNKVEGWEKFTEEDYVYSDYPLNTEYNLFSVPTDKSRVCVVLSAEAVAEAMAGGGILMQVSGLIIDNVILADGIENTGEIVLDSSYPAADENGNRTSKAIPATALLPFEGTVAVTLNFVATGENEWPGMSVLTAKGSLLFVEGNTYPWNAETGTITFVLDEEDVNRAIAEGGIVFRLDGVYFTQAQVRQATEYDYYVGDWNTGATISEDELAAVSGDVTFTVEYLMMPGYDWYGFNLSDGSTWTALTKDDYVTASCLNDYDWIVVDNSSTKFSVTVKEEAVQRVIANGGGMSVSVYGLVVEDVVIGDVGEEEPEGDLVFLPTELDTSGYGYTAEALEDGALAVSFEDQYQEIRFEFPEEIDLSEYDKLVVTLETASLEQKDTVVLKVIPTDAEPDQYDNPTPITEVFGVVKNPAGDVEVDLSRFADKKIDRLGIMASEGPCDANVYRIAFLAKGSSTVVIPEVELSTLPEGSLVVTPAEAYFDGYGFAKEESENGALAVSFEDEYQEIRFRFPNGVDLSGYDKLVVTMASASAEQKDAVALKVIATDAELDEWSNLNPFYTEWGVVKYPGGDVIIDLSEYADKTVERLSVMSHEGAFDAEVYIYRIAFLPKEGGSTTPDNPGGGGDDVTPTDPIEAFVTRMYRIILEREPDAGSATWVNGLKDGSMTGVRVADGFVLSDEMLNKDISNEEFVKILYRAFFGREADADGLATWKNLLDAGCKKTYVFAGFANSTEFGTLCAEAGIVQGRAAEYLADRQTGLSEADYKVWCFVERMYMEVLNRTADEPGVRSWVGALQDGSMTGVQVADGFIMSEEFLAKNMTNEEYVRIMYRAFFGRDADAEGLATWTNALATGWTKQDVFAGFANSNEFGVLCGQAGIVQGTAEGK